MKKLLILATVFVALSGWGATIKFITDYPNSIPLDTDFMLWQRNAGYVNSSAVQTRTTWFTSPVFTGNGSISGNFSIGGNLVFGGIGYGDGSGFSNIVGTATTTYINNVTNNIFYNTNVAFFNNTYVTNITVEVPGGLTNLNLTPLTLMYSDVNDAEASLPNAVGVLTNDGSGAIGYSTSLSFDEFDATDAYMTNVFVPYTNALISTDGNGKLTNAVVSTGLTFSGNALVATGVSSLADATNEVTRQINSGTNIYVGLGTAISDISKGTNNGFGLKTNNVGGGAFVFGGPGTGATLYDTNITAATTLKLFDITACSATAGGIKLYVTCSGGTDRILTFPAGCTGAGYGTPPAITITNAKAAFFDIIYKPGATPVTNVFWSPVF